jgi:predicted RNA-binding Zn-ribbon protein involved in translation (DUF1610 family)
MEKKNFRKELANLESQIKARLKELCASSKITSAHVKDVTIIPVNICDYTELRFENGTLHFISKGGYEYSLYCDVTNDDLINIIEQEEERQNNMLNVQWVQSVLKQEVINKASINIVTCGNCGSVVLHKIGCQKITCPDCGFSSEPCDFPDL